MKKIMPALAMLSAILILPAAASAESLYVTQSGGGSGTSPSSPMSVSQFNSASKWGSGTGLISPGDTVYFSGTITTQIKPPGSGTDGNYVTLDGYYEGKLDPVADRITFTGVHTGQSGASSLSTIHADWIPDYLVGTTIWNWDDRSKCTVTSNGANSVTCSLLGGSDNDWDFGDWFTIQGDDIDLIPNLPEDRAVLYPGTGTSTLDGSAIRINGKEYIIIQDFEVDGEEGNRYHGIYVHRSNTEPGSHVIVRRNYVHDVDNHCIEVDPNSNGEIPSYITIGGADGDGNLVYNCNYYQSDPSVGWEAQGFDIGTFGDDLIISHNEAARFWQYLGLPGENAHSSQNYAIFTGNRVLFEYNTQWWSDGEAGLSIKEANTEDGIFRFNKFVRAGAGGAISVSTTQATNKRIYLYGNAAFGSFGGFRTYKDYDDVYYWSNIASGSDQLGLWVGGRSSGDCVELTRWYNNAVYQAGNNQRGLYSDESQSNLAGMRVNLVDDPGCTPDCMIENNIFQDNDPKWEHDQLYLYSNIDSYLHALDYNTYFRTGGSVSFYKLGTGRLSFSQLRADGWESNGNEQNPGFIDPDGPDNVLGTPDDDLRLDGTHVDDGADLSQCFSFTIQGKPYQTCLQEALDPDRTDWTTTPPTVYTLSQNDYGPGWERGAYVYTGGSSPTYECSDSLDNDGDGLSDLSDPGCSSPTDDDETNCGDGRCEGGETCSSCSDDCLTPQGQVCCSGTLYPGDCCTSSQCASPLTCSSHYCSEGPDLCDGLSALWHLDSGASDSSPNANDGTLYGPSPASGRFSGAYSFDGSSDYIQFQPSDSLSSTSLTLSAWVYLPSPIQSGWRTIMEHDRGGSDWYGLFKSYGSDRFHFRWSSSATSDFSSTISPDTWHHVAATYDASTGTATMYLDGDPDGQVTGAPGPTDHNGNLRIGMNNDGSEAISAVIDEVAVWSRALSASEVQSLQGGPLTCGTTPPQDTCSSLGFQCCSACSPGTGQPAYDDDCPGVCCGECYQEPGQNFLPGVPVEAESATLSSPMQAGSDPLASGGSYIFTTARDQGSADYVFDIAVPGDYYIEARIIAPDISSDSFFCFMDGEQLQDPNLDSWDTIETADWTWVNVTRRGSGTMSVAEFDPMVWHLDEGLHTVHMLGREENTLLDRFVLRRLAQASHRADTSGDGCIDSGEILAFIDLWYQDSTEYPMGELMEAVALWYAGC